MAGETPLLRLENVSKEFYGVTVFSNVTVAFNKGEIVGLVGENGAGKTTLMHILFGMPAITDTGGYSGTLYLNDKPVFFKNPFDALDAGIGMVHQEFSLIPGFTTAENIMLNREPRRFNPAVEIFGERLGTLKREVMAEHSQQAMGRLGIQISSDAAVLDMPIGHKQFTEIAREIDRDQMKLLVLDEPTAVLTETEADILLDALKRLARKGIGIIFISHRLHEVVRIAHRVIVLRDGAIIKDIPNKNIHVLDLASWMVGREIGETGAGSLSRNCTGETLKVDRLWVDMPGETVRDVSFTVKQGEIFGIGGLAGQGKLGIPNGVMGLYAAGGQAVLNGLPLQLGNPKAALDAGIAFVSEDRRGAGLLLEEPLDWNIAFGLMQTKGGCLKSYFGGLFTLRDEKAIRALAEEYIKKLNIKCTGYKQPAKELSGGNQQKLCLAKAFALEPNLLFVSEPTRGVDIGAKKIVLDTLKAYNKNKGAAIVIVSSELEELRAVCDRIAIVDEGRIAGILSPGSEIAEFGILMSGKRR